MACSFGSATVVLAAAERIPNLEARALSPTVGWLVLVAAVAFAGLCILHADRWRRLWLRAEDPRTLGLFRILFAALLLLNLAGMWEHLEFLFTDEGLFYTDTARKALAAKQFTGYDEETGFAGVDGWLAFLRGPRYSLLLLRSDPAFFWLHLSAYVVAVVFMMVGFRTRASTVVAWLLMTSLTGRNPIYWTGADVVYKVFFFLLVLSRSGHAYSVDNWLRCRRLRRLGRLSEPGGPGGGAGLAPSADHPQGLAAIYRRIPAWPRLLMMMQLATIYLYTGSAKTGGTWSAGDSLYYALNLDHFYRTPPQLLSWMFGTNVFRLMTWTVHFWQLGFPLVLVGLVARFQIREGLAPPVGWRAHLTRLLWIVVGLAALGVTIVALPVHYTERAGGLGTATVQILVALGWVAAMVVIGLGWRRLRDRPPTLRIRGHALRIDLEGVCTWLLGRRLWLTIGLFFHLQIFMLMNIGMFAPIMIMVYLCCLNGTETASILRALGRVLGRSGGPPIPPEDPTLPWLHHDRRLSPGAAPSAGPWAYGRVGRVLANAVIVTHIVAVAIHCIPAKDSCWSFRATANEIVKPWLTLTQTSQSWEMFAPNPMRTNDFLEVLVTDANGEVWDLHTDANSPRNKQVPWIWYDRAGKITRRVIGDGKWYRKWLARYHCRRWALDHEGEAPLRVELVRVWYTIPPPGEVVRRGYYRAAELLERTGKRESLLTVRCAREEDGQLTNEIRARHGLPLVDERTIVRRQPKRHADAPQREDAPD